MEVAAFIRDIEDRIAHDEEVHTCCVCYEPLAFKRLECRHKLCLECYDQLDECPMCRATFRNDKLEFKHKAKVYHVTPAGHHIPAPQFAHTNLHMCMRKSVQYADTHEIVCEDMSYLWYLYTVDSRVAGKNGDNLMRFMRNGLPKMLIKDPQVFFDVCKAVGEPLVQIPYNGTKTLFAD